MSNPIQIKSLRMTCESCPVQYEGWTVDNRQIYIRYRFGYLTVSVGKVGDDEEFAAVNGECVFSKRMGGEYDGFLSSVDLVKAIRGVVEWPLQSQPKEQSGREPDANETRSE
jgi:hypothetical protein